MIKKILKMTLGSLVAVPAAIIYCFMLMLSTVMSIAYITVATRVIDGKKILFINSRVTKLGLSIYNTEEIRKAALLTAYTTGGTAVKVSTLLSAIKPNIEKMVQPFVLWPYLIMGIEYQVNVYKESTSGLSKKELEAVRQHEIGHIVNGDLDHDVVQQGTTIEMEADSYAAWNTGASHMASALKKIVANGKKHLEKEGIEVSVDLENQIALRLHALRS
jgi:Zn-dependent protease with chaperone function